IDDDAKEHIAKKMKTTVVPITEILQMPPLEDNNSFDFDLAEPTAQFLLEDTINKQQQNVKMKTTSDIIVESDSEFLHQVLPEATLPKPTYSAIGSGKNTIPYNRTPTRNHIWVKRPSREKTNENVTKPKRR
ncbi:7019_t:CDS:2, partial [Gigaspora margarita]